MDKIARKVLSKWLWKAVGDYRPEIPEEVISWSDSRLARYQSPFRDRTIPITDDMVVDPLQDAKLSIEIMFPKILDSLRKKFRDKFYVNSTSRRSRVYYYFSAEPAIETITVTLDEKQGNVFIGVGYVPHNAVSGADYSRSIHRTVKVRDPELAGLELMRQLRSLLSRV